MYSVSDRVNCIVQGMESYFQTFALADNMVLHTGDIEWVCPQPSSRGPSIVYKVSLDEKTIKARLEKILPEIQAGIIPSFCVISPVSTPTDIVDTLLAAGFTGLADPKHPEPGMALELDGFSWGVKTNPDIEIKKVKSLTEYAAWIDVVNAALHGWKLLTIEHYAAWLHHPPLSFYLGCQDRKPIATLATIHNGETASIEFVSTLKEHRHQGAATALCIRAIKELQRKGARVVTLRSSPEAVSVYTRLGFQSYYEQILLSYPSKKSI